MNTSLVRLVGVRQLNRGNATLYDFTVVNDDNEAQPAVGIISLAGYEVPEEGDAVSDTDTLLEAIGKLEARLVVLEEA